MSPRTHDRLAASVVPLASRESPKGLDMKTVHLALAGVAVTMAAAALAAPQPAATAAPATQPAATAAPATQPAQTDTAAPATDVKTTAATPADPKKAKKAKAAVKTAAPEDLGTAATPGAAKGARPKSEEKTDSDNPPK